MDPPTDETSHPPREANRVKRHQLNRIKSAQVAKSLHELISEASKKNVRAYRTRNLKMHFGDLKSRLNSNSILGYADFTRTFILEKTVAVAQWVRAFALEAEGCVFESQPQQKKDSDSSTAKLSAIGVSVRGPSEMTIIYGCPGHSRCGTLKHPHCSMAMSAEHRPSSSGKVYSCQTLVCKKLSLVIFGE